MLEPHSVGSRNSIVSDTGKNLSFPIWVLYPTKDPAQPITFGPYKVNVAPDAPMSPGRHPLVVLSHGGGSTFLVYRTLAAHLAEHGYVVVMPEHYGDNRNNRSWDHTVDNLECRPRHVRLSIDAVAADPFFKDHVDTSNLALLGHSMGGYTSLAVAGGQPYWSPDRAITVTRDARVKALVLLAPATCWFVPNEALRGVKVPILMRTAELDEITYEWQAHLLLNGVADRQQVSWKVVANAGHYSFLSPFPTAMKNPNFLPGIDPAGFNREKFHAQLNDDILTFLNRTLLLPS
jgi:predicted dienelactone hydrolase